MIKHEVGKKKNNLMDATVIGFLAILVFLTACGGGGGSGGLDSEIVTPDKIYASQVIFKNSIGQYTSFGIKGFQNISSEPFLVDSSIYVLAENVLLAPYTSSLDSQTLQDAIDDEIAPDLNMLLPGTTWSVANKSGDEHYEGTDGQVTFNNDGSIAYIGAVAAFGIGAPICWPSFTATYEVLSSRAIYLSREQDANTSSNVVHLISSKKDQLVFVGQGGCGLSGTDRISYLTLVPTIGL